MKKDLDKESLEVWYQANKITADCIINDLRKQTYEAVMHIYAYTSRLLQLEHIVSQKDFPHLFSNHYTRVGDSISGIMALLIGEWNINIGKKTIDNTLCYWLTCGKLYETLVSKIIIKAEEEKELIAKNGFDELQQQLIENSIDNGIQTRKEWNCFLGLRGQQIENSKKSTKEVLIELQSDEANKILNKAISVGLCDDDYHWLKSKELLAYFGECVSDKLNLCKAVQNDRKKTSWKPFEKLFGISGISALSGHRNTYANKLGKLPIGYELVDSILL